MVLISGNIYYSIALIDLGTAMCPFIHVLGTAMGPYRSRNCNVFLYSCSWKCFLRAVQAPLPGRANFRILDF